MSQIARITTWVSGQVLTASALNGEFNNIINAWNNIDSASASWTTLSVAGNLSVGGTLAVTGNVTSVIVFNPGSNQPVRLNNQTFASAGGVIEIGRKSDGSYTCAVGSGQGSNEDLVVATATGAAFVRYNAGISGGAHAFYIGETLANLFANSRPTTTLYAKITAAGLSFSNSAGLVGTIAADNASAGNVGEYSEAIVSSFGNCGTSAQFANITSFTLAAGDWDVIGTIELQINGATASGVFQGAVSTNSGNTTTDHVVGSNQIETGIPTANSATCTTIFYRVNVSTSTLVYLKALATYSAGTPRMLGSIKARRRR